MNGPKSDRENLQPTGSSTISASPHTCIRPQVFAIAATILHPSSSFLFIYGPSPGGFPIFAKILYEPPPSVYQINRIPTPAHFVSQTPLRILSVSPDEPVPRYNPAKHSQTHNGIRNGKAPRRQDGRCDRCFCGNW